MPKPFDLDASDIRLLTEIGFLGAGYGLTGPAERVFQGLRTLRPERGFPYIGLGLCLLSKGDAEGAAKLLEQSLPVAGEDGDMVKAFQGYALLLAKRSHHGQAVLEQLAETGGDPQAVKLARSLLQGL